MSTAARTDLAAWWRHRSESGARVRAPRVGVLMALAIALVAALAYWDARGESNGALDDFAREQATLARAIAAALESRVNAVRATEPALVTEALLSDLRAVERPSSVRLFLVRPRGSELRTTDGKAVTDGNVEHALRNGLSWVRLDRNEAPAFGLPQRTAAAGLATFVGVGGRWGVVVAATALRERDREVRAQWRSVIAVLLASGLVFVFGGVAAGKERKELELARGLEVAELTRQREEQLVEIDKLATMAALATGIAHEVSTPLGVIVGRAEQLLPKVADDDRATRGVESIIEQGTRISRVVRGFLNLARGEFPTLERVSPGFVAEAARELVRHRFEKAKVRLDVSIDADLPPVSCDPRLIEQVLIHLLLNACDACGPGGRVELAVRVERDRVSFVVTDDGVGITEDVAARATEPFFTTKSHPIGSGLGLAIANELVKHHGGALAIGPRYGGSADEPPAIRGTLASVELPIAR
jgi:signal transduction histidine kinase